VRISKPVIQSHGDQTRYEVQTDQGPLWFSVQTAFSDFISSNADAALAGLLIPAMLRGEDIEIEGNVSARLHYNLNGRMQALVRSVLPELKPVRITASSLTTSEAEAEARPRGVATGFSGGIDSYCVVADHLLTDCSPHYRLTHLLYNDVGAHGAPGKFDFYFDKISKAAAPLGLPIIKVASNLADFYPAHPTFQQTHTFRNAAVALLLQGGIGKFLYASTYQYADLKFAPSNDIAFADAAAVPLLSTESIETVSAGSEHTRVGKTLIVSQHPETYQTLDVCTGEDHSKNCSTCFKCMRTMLTLDIAGKLNRYRDAFDLEKYRANRAWYIGHVLAADDPFSREIADFMRRENFPIPLASRSHQIRARARQAVGR
jgi:hypothetical protein